MSGKVYLAGAGPGDPELLTAKALRILRDADVVLHDDLVSWEILALANPRAIVRNVGKRCGKKRCTQDEIHDQMVDYARRGLAVMRLKGGDPLLFGRAGEEMEALRAAGIELEVIPGVTAASAAAAVVQIPLTDRRCASAVVFVTGHRRGTRMQFALPSPLPSNATIVVYMPGENLRELVDELRNAGLDDETPCLLISQASSSEQETFHTTLKQLPRAPRMPRPAILIVGQVAAGVQANYADAPAFAAEEADCEEMSTASAE